MSLSPARPRLYWETVRHLKPVQIYGRLWFHAVRPKPDLRPAPLLRPQAAWIIPARRRQSQIGPHEFRFLNETRSLSQHGWDDPAVPKLWRYNLHYFDDLNAENAEQRTPWHAALIGRWIAENAPARGTGWEPYPTSLRIVNWIKWARCGNRLSSEATDSLAVQARWLARRPEYHLLGNHLFANAKALVFAACFFSGEEAEAWLDLGLRILAREVPRQILADGGQFELSPMYHALALEDILDLVNVMRSAGALAPPFGTRRLRPCGAGSPPCVIRTARSPCSTMRLSGSPSRHGNWKIMPPVSASRRRPGSTSRSVPAGQRLSPARRRIERSHCSTSRELARTTFRATPMPTRFPSSSRSTDGASSSIPALLSMVTGPNGCANAAPARTTRSEIDGENSSEVWSGFRVARRARPEGLAVMQERGEWIVTCRHDGYARLGGGRVTGAPGVSATASSS